MTRSTQQPKPDRKVTTLRLQEMKVAKEKISALTAYDFLTARLLDSAGIDVILVGTQRRWCSPAMTPLCR